MREDIGGVQQPSISSDLVDVPKTHAVLIIALSLQKDILFPPHPAGHIGTNSLQTRADRPCSASSLRRRERLIYTEVWFSLVTQPRGFTFKCDRGTGGCLKASECIFIKVYSSFIFYALLYALLAPLEPPRTHTHTP